MSNRAFVTYFGVEDTQSLPTTCTVSGETSASSRIPISSVVLETMREVLELHTPTRENVKERDLFYVISGWYPEQEAMDKFKGVDTTKLLRIPKDPSEDMYSQKEAIRNIVENAIRSVNLQPYSSRWLVNGTAAAMKDKAFSSLQTEAAVKEYALVFTRVFLLLLHLKKEPATQVPLPDSVSEAVGLLFDSGHNITSTDIFEIIHNLLEESTTTNAILVLFVRFSCHMADGSLRSADDIS